jgi:ABC-type polysaccharide/polyol phosphate export permease
MSTRPPAVSPPIAVIGGQPDSAAEWMRSIWSHREVLGMLSRADFQVRYKRASFGVAWAVLVPLIQAAVLAVVFSKLIRVPASHDFGAYVLAGVLAWSYFALTVGTASIAIVEGSGLTDKVWFPRALLTFVPALANLPGLAVSMLFMFPALPLLGSSITPRLLLLPVACALLVLFTASLSTVLAALHVYFRDVKFIVQAALLVWFYVTPVAYPKSLLHGLAGVVDFNPMTGIITLFQMATVGHAGAWVRPVIVSVVVTAVLMVVVVETQRRHDRLFVDLL